MLHSQGADGDELAAVSEPSEQSSRTRTLRRVPGYTWLGTHHLRGAPQDSARLERAATLSRRGAVNLSLHALGEFISSLSREATEFRRRPGSATNLTTACLEGSRRRIDQVGRQLACLALGHLDAYQSPRESSCPLANGTLMARGPIRAAERVPLLDRRWRPSPCYVR